MEGETRKERRERGRGGGKKGTNNENKIDLGLINQLSFGDESKGVRGRGGRGEEMVLANDGQFRVSQTLMQVVHKRDDDFSLCV